MNKQDLNTLIEKISQGDPKKKEVVLELKDALLPFLTEHHNLIITPREMDAFMAGMIFMTKFHNDEKAREIDRTEKDIVWIQSEIAAMHEARK